MKVIDADAFDAVLVDAQKRAKSNFQFGFLSSVRANLKEMPEAEAYIEQRKRIENMEKVIEDLEERIAIMTEGGWCPDWHFIKFREPTDEEKEYYKDEYGEYNEGDADNFLMLENAPADGEEVLLWTWCGFTLDTYNDGEFDGAGEIEEGMAWAYLPEPPKDGEAE